jgi:hypothetical protein
MVVEMARMGPVERKVLGNLAGLVRSKGREEAEGIKILNLVP